jgi:cell division protein ZapE
MPDKLKQWYKSQIDSGALRADDAQAFIVDAFQEAIKRAEQAENVEAISESGGFFSKLFGGGKAQAQSIMGLYVHGGVGRGKTMIMDEAFALCDISRKKRSHFNDFMLDVYRRLKGVRARAKDGEDIKYLEEVASQIASEVRLLAFDEFQVRDIADAMIMAGLFSALFARGVVVLATSNVAPDDLYQGGLQRIRFLPFIEILKRHVEVVHMDSPTDYRLAVNSAGGVDAQWEDLYLTPIGSVNYALMHNLFKKVTGGASEKVSLSLPGREWVIAQGAVHEACFIGFAEACERPRAAEDYIALAEKFPVIFLHDTPKMGYDRRNEAKRFILLIDTIYDKGARLVISAEAEPELLYYGKDHEFEFQRTISRLQEMRRMALPDFT